VKSAEHEVAFQSAKNVIEAIDKKKYEIVLIGIDKTGMWHLQEKARYLLNEHNPKLIALNLTNSTHVVSAQISGRTELVTVETGKSHGAIDVVFPVLHGPFGEDGTIQGMLKLMDVPFVGAGVLGSAVGMDKDVAKRLLRDAGIPTAHFLTFARNKLQKINFKDVKKELGLPLFIKPANLGSSVGIHKAKNEPDFNFAIKDAFKYDNKILIEEFIKGREIECSVLGNEAPIASIPGEIIPRHEYYSYEAKYIDEKGANLEIPARLPEEVIQKVQTLAIKTFQTLCCEGMARVDFFLTEDNRLYVNEINTIPGFTKISMYPKLWEISGISYGELIDRLIQLAIERYKLEKELKVSYETES
jgi:D-alanine-D-alanine ligase